MKLIQRFLEDESGSASTDYALIVAFVAVLSISGIAGVDETVGSWYERSADSLINAVSERPS